MGDGACGYCVCFDFQFYGSGRGSQTMGVRNKRTGGNKMKKGNISIGIAIAIVVMIAIVMALSGCIEDASDITKDISEIGSEQYSVTLIKGVKRDLADSEYGLLIHRIRGRQNSALSDVPKRAEVVIEIFSNNISIGQKTLEAGLDKEVKIERLTLGLNRVDTREEYASIRISERIDIAGYGEKAVGAVGDIAKSVAESQS